MTTKTDTTTDGQWSADPRWALPAVLAAWVWAIGWAPAWAARVESPFPPWWMAALGVAAALLGLWRAKRQWPHVRYGEGLLEQGQLLSVVTGVCVAVFLVRAGYSSPWQQTPLGLVLAVVCGGWFAALTTSAPERAREENLRILAAHARDDDDALRAILDRSGGADILIYRHDETRAGHTYEVGPDPSFEHRPSYGDAIRIIDKLRTNLAIYWRERDGTVLEARDVHLEYVSIDRWLLHVSTKHVLQEVVRYRPADLPPSFNAPIELGLYEDGARMAVRLLGRNMAIVGATGGGKSVIANNIIARTLECRDTDGNPDALVWVAATQKLVPLVFPWLLPWFTGATARPCLDWIVGEDPDHVMRFLVAVYDLARDRNKRLTRKSKTTASGALPAVMVILEEAKLLTTSGYKAFMGRDPVTKDAVYWDASRLINETIALTRSSAVSVVMITQQGLFEGLGSWGSQMQRNITVRACTVTMTDSDGHGMLPRLPASVRTTDLKNSSMYLQLGLDEDSRAAAGKAAKVDEDDVLPIAARVDRVARLEPRGVEAIGADLYAMRWDEDYQSDLAVALREEEGIEWSSLQMAFMGAAAVDPEPAAEPAVSVDTAPSGAPVPPPGGDGGHHGGDDGTFGWRPEWQEELDALLKGNSPAAPDTADGPRSETVLPWVDDSIGRLEALAQQAREEEAAHFGEASEESPAATRAVRDLPQPLAAVIAYLDSLPACPDWIGTAQLAVGVYGPFGSPDAESSATHALGKALSGNVRGLTTERNPRAFNDGTGRRGRGYLVRRLYAAADLYRAGRDGFDDAE